MIQKYLKGYLKYKYHEYKKVTNNIFLATSNDEKFLERIKIIEKDKTDKIRNAVLFVEAVRVKVLLKRAIKNKRRQEEEEERLRLERERVKPK